ALKGARARVRVVQGLDPEHPEAVSLEMTDVAADQLTLRQGDGQSYSIANGQARRIAFSAAGVVTLEGLSGELTGNVLYNGSQLWLQHSTLTSGAVQIDANGRVHAGPLQLTRVRASATGMSIPPESSEAIDSGVSADIHRLDLDAEAAALSVDPDRGITFT